MIVLNRATEDNWADLFAWRNDDATVQASLTRERVALSVHLKWLKKTLNDKSVHLFIAHDWSISAKVGMGRLNTDDERGIELSVTVAPEHRGRGYASQIVSSLMTEAYGITKDSALFARVREDNMASLRAFATNGFRFSKMLTGPETGVVELFLR